MSVIAQLARPAASARYEGLLRAANAIAACNDCDSAADRLADELHRIVAFDYLQVLVFDSGTSKVVWQLTDIRGRREDAPAAESSAPSDAGLWVYEHGEPVFVNDWAIAARFPRQAEVMRQFGLSSGCVLPLIRGQRRLGVMTFGSPATGSYSVEEIHFLSLVADQIALAIDAAVNFYSSRRAEDQLRLILDLNNQVVSNLDFPDLLHAISASVRQIVHCDAAAIMLPDAEGKLLHIHALDFPDGKGFFREESLPIAASGSGAAFQTGKPVVINRLDDPEVPAEMRRKAAAEGIHSFCDVALVSRNRRLGVLAVGRRPENAFDEDDVAFLCQVAAQVAIAVDNAQAYGEIAELRDKLAQEKLYLEDEIRGEMDFEGIVGQSSALRHVLSLVETVAPSDSTVLLLGETGTGKELIARAIHERSRRQQRTFVKLNCAAIPSGLLESELFGHERGAFTGAISQKIGRLELADLGTLFLDEVGDIPGDIQPKLLRALQEREFERLGSTRTKKVDVRLVAATNRDLAQMVLDREFRSDLFYRLNVFPIRIPPLRERPEDIPLLVRYFAQKYGRRMEKRIESIPAAAMKRLSAGSWPGNIRELENFIERSVILTHGATLQVPIGELSDAGAPVASLRSPHADQREEILRVLKETRGRVAGPEGAAARLGIKRTTLISRMKKLGIDARQLPSL